MSRFGVRRRARAIGSRLARGALRVFADQPGPVIEPAARAAAIRELTAAWRSPEIPARQASLVERQLAQFRGGERVTPFDAFVTSLQSVVSAEPRLLEVGCSTGYYADVLEARDVRVRYEGCDFSPAFITAAQKRRPDLSFHLGDATALPFADESFDIVVSGCCIVHIPDYPRAIAEAARVSKRWVVLARTPVLTRSDTTWFRKSAYGVECIEIHFGQADLFRTLAAAGLSVVDAVVTGEETPSGRDVAVGMNYVCRRID